MNLKIDEALKKLGKTRFELAKFMYQDIELATDRWHKLNNLIHNRVSINFDEIASMKAMHECNSVYKLDNWQDSNGAKNEINQAEFFNLNILN